MKKIKIIGVFVIFILSVISHFMYEWFPNRLFSIIFPVNESIWEHMKLIATPVLIFGVIEYLIYKVKRISFNHFLLSYSISIILGIIGYLIIYLPIHYMFGHSTVVAIILLFITFIFIEIIHYYMVRYKWIKYDNIIGVGIILFLYILFGYLTYYPLEIDLFYDSVKNIYGIPK